MLKKITTFSFLIIFAFGFELALPAQTIASDLSGSVTTGVVSGSSGSAEGVVKAKPVVSPAAGDYHATQSVTLTASGATSICYTVDGTEPSCANSSSCTVGSIKYTGVAISVTSAKSVKSVACYGDNTQGPKATTAYTFSCSASAPTNGTISAYSTCALACNSGYTLSGSTCTAADSGGVVSSGGGGGGGYYDVTPPTSTSIIIAGGADSTLSTGVNLALSAIGASHMMISDNSTFAGASWEYYSTTKAWTLTPGLGAKTVYAKFKDATGNISAAVSDTINLTVTATTPAGTTTTTTTGGTTVTTPAVTTTTTTTTSGTTVTTIGGGAVSGVSAVFTSPLSVGSTGEAVTRLQTLLATDPEVYPEGIVTGYFGSLTVRAVQRFQVKYGVANPGDVGYGNFGPATRAKMNVVFGGAAVTVPTTTATVSGISAIFTQKLGLGSTGEAVTRLQTLLATDPEVYPEGKVTGYFGGLTVKAIQRFQVKYGVANPGDVGYGNFGPATRAKMNVVFGGAAVVPASTPAVSQSDAESRAQLDALNRQMAELLRQLGM